MPRARTDIGTAKRLDAEVFGEPGKRTFRIVVEADKGIASVWMEKEQLSALALSVKSYVKQLSEEQRKAAVPPPETSSAEPAFEFKTVSLGLVFDETSCRFGVIAFDETDRGKQTGTMMWWATLGQAEAMADTALEIVSSGRPICDLCHRPKDPEGHMCPHTNGHRGIQEDFE